MLYVTMGKKDWKREAARDVLALGSWVFYFLVIGRALIKPYRPFADQVIIAGMVLIILGFVLKDSENYIARGLVLVVLTGIFYGSFIYNVFVGIVFLMMLFCSFFIGNSIWRIVKGAIVGGVSVLIGLYLPLFDLYDKVF